MPKELNDELDHLIGLEAVGFKLNRNQQRKLNRLMKLYEEICC